jgi:hypothetical protein
MNSPKPIVREHCRPLRVAATLLVSLLCLAACYGGGPKPTDAELLAGFRTHRLEIATLMKMMEEDRVLRRVDCNWTDPSNPLSAGISADRIAQYRRILFDIDCPRGFYYDPNTGSVTIITWAVGLALAAIRNRSCTSRLIPPPSFRTSIHISTGWAEL